MFVASGFFGESEPPFPSGADGKMPPIGDIEALDSPEPASLALLGAGLFAPRALLRQRGYNRGR